MSDESAVSNHGYISADSNQAYFAVVGLRWRLSQPGESIKGNGNVRRTTGQLSAA